MEDDPTVVCPRCGKENPASNALCDGCQEPLAEPLHENEFVYQKSGHSDSPASPPDPPDPVSVTELLVCRACGATLTRTGTERALKCKYCGSVTILREE